jgi:hypothetical protein
VQREKKRKEFNLCGGGIWNEKMGKYDVSIERAKGIVGSYKDKKFIE